MLRGDAERHLLALTADHHGRPARAQRRRRVDGLHRAVVATLERRSLVAEHRPADLDRLEHLHPLTDRREVDAECFVLHVEPGRADAEQRMCEMTSSVLTILARMAGLRYVTPVTSVPSMTRSVRAAMAASSVYASNISLVGGPSNGSW